MAIVPNLRSTLLGLVTISALAGGAVASLDISLRAQSASIAPLVGARDSSGDSDRHNSPSAASDDHDQSSPEKDNPPAASAPENRHELRLGLNTDAFTYTTVANAESVALTSKWSQRLSTYLSETPFQRFGEAGAQTNALLTFRFTPHVWVTGGGGFANRQDVVAREQADIELGIARRLNNRFVKGTEFYLQQRDYWFTSSKVSAFGITDLFYLPRDWSFTLSSTAARTILPGFEPAWTPSAFAKVSFPIASRLGGSLTYGFGAENFAAADQIGRISAHSFGCGLRVRLNRNQDITWSFALQDRSQGQKQYNNGVSYGYRF